MKIFLDIKDGKIVASLLDGVFTFTVNTITDFNNLSALATAHDLAIFTSSSLDFPTEYTTDPAVIDLANAIRGAV